MRQTLTNEIVRQEVAKTPKMTKITEKEPALSHSLLRIDPTTPTTHPLDSTEPDIDVDTSGKTVKYSTGAASKIPRNLQVPRARSTELAPLFSGAFIIQDCFLCLEGVFTDENCALSQDL